MLLQFCENKFVTNTLTWKYPNNLSIHIALAECRTSDNLQLRVFRLKFKHALPNFHAATFQRRI